jgi:hypothetical protein
MMGGAVKKGLFMSVKIVVRGESSVEANPA